MTRKTAEALAEEIKDAQEKSTKTLTTKRDIENLKQEIKISMLQQLSAWAL